MGSPWALAAVAASPGIKHYEDLTARGPLGVGEVNNNIRSEFCRQLWDEASSTINLSGRSSRRSEPGGQDYTIGGPWRLDEVSSTSSPCSQDQTARVPWHFGEQQQYTH